MKKVCSLLLSVGLLVSTAVPAFAVESTTPSPIICSAEGNIPKTVSSPMTEAELRAVYWASSEFQAHYADDPADALASLDKAVEDYFSSFISTCSTTNDEVASVDTTLVQQLNGYTCGPASSYMAIDGWNGTGSITGTTTTAKLTRLATQMESNSSDGTYVYKLKNVLNTYTDDYDYAYYAGSTLDEFLFRVYTFNSLAYDRAPILHAKTAALSYYNGHNTGHYIAVTKFDYNTMEVRLHDPNNTAAYYGIHQVPYEEAYSSIADYSGRYYICYWP
jgi:hypothetical protein